MAHIVYDSCMSNTTVHRRVSVNRKAIKRSLQAMRNWSWVRSSRVARANSRLTTQLMHSESDAAAAVPAAVDVLIEWTRWRVRRHRSFYSHPVKRSFVRTPLHLNCMPFRYCWIHQLYTVQLTCAIQSNPIGQSKLYD